MTTEPASSTHPTYSPYRADTARGQRAPRRPAPALTVTRRLTAGAMLAASAAVGGIGVHLASSYAASHAATSANAGTSSGTGLTGQGSSAATGSRSSDDDESGSGGSSGLLGFTGVSGLGSSSGAPQGTTSGS